MPVQIKLAKGCIPESIITKYLQTAKLISVLIVRQSSLCSEYTIITL